MCISSLSLHGLSRGCVSKVDGCMVQVPIWVLPASAGVWGMTLAATPFALVQLVVGCGFCWLSLGSVLIGPIVHRLSLFIPGLCSVEGG